MYIYNMLVLENVCVWLFATHANMQDMQVRKYKQTFTKIYIPPPPA